VTASKLALSHQGHVIASHGMSWDDLLLMFRAMGGDEGTARMAERVRDLEEQLETAQREADIQLGAKLAAQMTLKAVCDALNLPMVSLGNGWTEATPKILARIAEIVDEGERGFRERDLALGLLDPEQRELVRDWAAS
jgi:hypothetical protein